MCTKEVWEFLFGGLSCSANLREKQDLDSVHLVN